MKKIPFILLSVFYLLASVGIAVNVHHCSENGHCDTSDSNEEACCCGHEEESNDCCEDETYFLQLDSEQQAPQNLRIIAKQLVSGIEVVFNNNAVPETISGKNIFERNDLPPPQKQPVWLLNCSLTFYG